MALGKKQGFDKRHGRALGRKAGADEQRLVIGQEVGDDGNAVGGEDAQVGGEHGVDRFRPLAGDDVAHRRRSRQAHQAGAGAIGGCGGKRCGAGIVGAPGHDQGLAEAAFVGAGRTLRQQSGHVAGSEQIGGVGRGQAAVDVNVGDDQPSAGRGAGLQEVPHLGQGKGDGEVGEQG